MTVELAPPDDASHRSACDILEPENYEAIFQGMVNQGTRSSLENNRQVGLLSFTDQIAKITRKGDPDCYLFTIKSAIPVADAVRGYYETIGRAQPPLGMIYVDHRDGFVRERANSMEARRLQPLLQGLGRISIVEQFVCTGRTLAMARAIVHQANPQIKTDNFSRSNWYHDALAADIDYENMTSTHAEFMHSVGVAAAKRVMAGQYHETPARLKLSAS